MPQFVYKAKTGPKDLITGYIQADTIDHAVNKLTQAGHTPIEIKPYEKSMTTAAFVDKDTGKASKVSGQALFQFTRQLADLLDAGIPLIRCMELCSRQRQFPAMVKIVELMMVQLQQGASFSTALAKYPSIFPPLYIQTVKAAEVSGHLPLVLDRLAQFLEQDLRMQSNIKASLLYPAIILGVGLLAIFVLFSFVLPRLTLMFEDFNATLPLATRIVVAISQFFAQLWWLIAIVLVSAGLWLRQFLATEQGKIWVDTTSLKIPILKSFIENAQLARFARTLGMLLESGVPVVVALELVTTVVSNRVLQEEVKKMSVKVRGGMSLTQAVKAAMIFPEMAIDLIAVGQESGRLEKGLYKLADGCERVSQELSQTFITILGPAVLVTVVGIVGFVILTMLLPMFQMNMIIN